MSNEKVKTEQNGIDETAVQQDIARSDAELTVEEQLSIQLAEKNEQLLRLAAEFDNYRKRMARQMEEVARTANDRILADVFDVVDNFERAIRTNGADIESMRKGTEMIYQQVLKLLASYDITPFDSLGQPFDPNKHEAMMKMPSIDIPEGCVALEIAKGFMQGERVIRHTKVAVSTGKPADDGSAATSSADNSK